jgi:hypothetical protein
MRYSEIIETPLTPGRMEDKMAARELFINMYMASTPFELFKGTRPKHLAGKKTVTLKIDNDTVNRLKNNDLQGIKFTSTHLDNEEIEVPISWGNLEKTADFGGKGSGFSTRDEDAALNHLDKLLKKLLKENDTTALNVKIGKWTGLVSGFVSTGKTPKSDFHAVNENGEAVAWISHKQGSKAGSFSGWGGMSDKEFLNVYKNYPEIEEVIVDFVKAVKKATKLPNVMSKEETVQLKNGQMSNYWLPSATTLARKIPPTFGRIRAITVYGNDFGGERGPQNVDLVLQGDPKFTEEDGVYTLVSANGTEYTHSNGERLENDWEPVFMAIHKPDRDNFGIKQARFSIHQAGGRKVTKWLN